MARLPALDRSELPQFESVFKQMDDVLGFTANDFLTMGRKPRLMEAVCGLFAAVMGDDTIDEELRCLVAYASSRASGCYYCSSHSASHGIRQGGSEAKFAALGQFETSELFDERERAAIRVAHKAGQVPNAVTDDDFTQLRSHFTDDQVVSVVATVAMMGLFNRWNDTVGTELEREVLGSACSIAAEGADGVAKHAPTVA